tara:strand:+ start:134 stop:808 length:675 start_codon:yes stop_codon:yes gene_type:complete
MTFIAISAISKNKGIGLNNQLPWNLKSDLKRFKNLTIGNGNNSIIMGKNTWLSTKFLKNRHNYILSSTLNINESHDGYEAKSFKDLNSLLIYLKSKNYNTNWVIGGSHIYNTFLSNNLLDFLYITFIDKIIECDCFFPTIPKCFLKKELTLANELYNGIHNVYYIVYKKIKKNDQIIYKNMHLSTIKEIHYDDCPNIYLTINFNDKEIQTNIDNIKLSNNNFSF